MDVLCSACGESVALETSRSGEVVLCPACGSRLVEPAAAGRNPPGLGEETRPLEKDAAGGAETLFQPGIMMSSILADTGSGTEPEKPRTEVPQPPAETQMLRSAPAPPPRLAVEAYFLVLGAPPGRERLPLVAARTVVGRADADLVLDDRAASAPHCQIDVMGSEFYVRDLDSRNGTFLNGHKVRYSQLLPGDELRVGKTILVFRTASDGFSDRGSTED